MSHVSEIVINTVNVGLSLLVLVSLVALARETARQGLNVVGARLFLRKKDALRALLLVLVGMIVFIASNVLELYGDIFHIDWYVNEAVETISLAPMFAGLARLQVMLRLPRRDPRMSTVVVQEIQVE